MDRLMALVWHKQAGAVTVRQVLNWLARQFHAGVPAALRRRLEDRETWDSLRWLDDRQLKDFGIHSRPPELSEHKFPQY